MDFAGKGILAPTMFLQCSSQETEDQVKQQVTWTVSLPQSLQAKGSCNL